jgi:hypothetical protein
MKKLFMLGLRYLSSAIIIYFSIIGIQETFLKGSDAGIFTKLLIYSILCLLPMVIIFFSSDEDIRNSDQYN